MTRKRNKNRSFFIACDGGRKPGYSYGSYTIYETDKELEHVSRRELPRANTSNEAEYLILIAALEHLNGRAHKGDKLLIKSDSKLMVNHLNGEWGVDKLKPLFIELVGLLKDFDWEAKWWHRSNSEKLFGH